MLTSETDKLLREYLGLKAKERQDGYTNEQVLQTVKNLTENLANHIQDDKREFANIHKRLDAHNARIETLEAKEPEMKPIPISKRESLAPPAVSDTGSHHIDPANWQKVTSYVEKLQHDNEVAEGVQSQLKKERDKWKDRFEFWSKIGAAIVATVTLGTAIVEWLVHHVH